MKLTKKHWMIIGVVAILIIVWYFFLRKKKAESGYIKTTDAKPTCRTGTCPGKHTDGSWWCSSAFCTSAESGYKTTKCKCNQGNKECGGLCGICCAELGGVKPVSSAYSSSTEIPKCPPGYGGRFPRCIRAVESGYTKSLYERGLLAEQS